MTEPKSAENDPGGPSESGYLIFVYGTLKTGFCRNKWLQNELLLGEARTRPVYRMYDCGEYPAMVRDSAYGVPVSGQVWRVTDSVLAQLDKVEAVDEGLYERANIELLDSFPQPVQGYLYLGDTRGMADCGESWTKGQTRN